MDHLFFPTMTDSSFLTEIHHIDGEGVDAGVVYCEMQARENEMEDIMEYERKVGRTLGHREGGGCYYCIPCDQLRNREK